MRYSPIQDTNALQSVIFVVNFLRKFTTDEIGAFDDPSRPWKQKFPRRTVMNAVLLSPIENKLKNDDRIVGIAYEKMKEDGSIELGLKFEDNRILFIVGTYTNWADIFPEVSEHLTLALALVSEDNPIVTYAMEYNDIFRATGNYFEFDASRLFQLKSKYIPSHIFERSENFHFHTGFFETREDPVKHRVLTRINADLRDGEKNIRELSIKLFHEIKSYQEPWTREYLWERETQLDKQITQRSLDNFVDLHELDKIILKEILNHDISAKIGL